MRHFGPSLNCPPVTGPIASEMLPISPRKKLLFCVTQWTFIFTLCHKKILGLKWVITRSVVCITINKICVNYIPENKSYHQREMYGSKFVIALCLVMARFCNRLKNVVCTTAVKALFRPCQMRPKKNAFTALVHK